MFIFRFHTYYACDIHKVEIEIVKTQDQLFIFIIEFKKEKKKLKITYALFTHNDTTVQYNR